MGQRTNYTDYPGDSDMDFSQKMPDSSASDGESISEKGSDSSMSEDSEGNVIKAKGRNSNLGAYEFLKIFNCMLYLLGLCFAIGYFRSSRYEMEFVYFAILTNLIGRPILIVLYSGFMICLEMRRR